MCIYDLIASAILVCMGICDLLGCGRVHEDEDASVSLERMCRMLQIRTCLTKKKKKRLQIRNLNSDQTACLQSGGRPGTVSGYGF